MAKRRANGENTIYFDKTKNCYKGQICIGYYKNGRVKRKSVFGKTRDEVRQKLKQLDFEIMNDDYVEPSNVTIFQLANQIFEETEVSLCRKTIFVICAKPPELLRFLYR